MIADLRCHMHTIFLMQLTVVKSNVPEEKTESILKHVYDAMDKFILEKV
jgi:hypothetical protein